GAGGVRGGFPADRLVQHVDVVVQHGPLDRLDDLRVEEPEVEPRDVQHREAGAGRDALDLDVAAGRQRVRRVDEPGQVIGLVALRGDRARVEEGLPAVGGRAVAEPAEVLEVEDDVLAAGADQVGVGRVDAGGGDGDRDP